MSNKHIPTDGKEIMRFLVKRTRRSCFCQCFALLVNKTQQRLPHFPVYYGSRHGNQYIKSSTRLRPSQTWFCETILNSPRKTYVRHYSTV